MTRLRKYERRKSILSAARAILAKRGFLGARAEDFAREARVSAGLLFRYFPSLHALQAAVVAKGLRQKGINWPRNLSKMPPHSALKAIASSFVSFFARDPDLLPLSLFGALVGRAGSVEPYRRELLSAARRLASLIRIWVRRGRAREIADADSLAWLLLSALAHTVIAEKVFALSDISIAPDRILNSFSALLKKGDRRDWPGLWGAGDPEIEVTRPPRNCRTPMQG
jgi:AcrR family transcriptional regulator